MSSNANTSASQSARVSARHHAPAARRRNYLKAGLLLLLALICGWIIGVSSTVLYFKTKMDRKRQRPNTEEIARDIAARMEKSVVLTPDERRTVEGIIQSHMNEVDRVRKQSFNVLWDEMDKMNEVIAEVLGPERNKKWEDDKDKHFGEERRRYHRRRQEHAEKLEGKPLSPEKTRLVP